ncbi:hypothetical protein GCM10023320_59970 [Pseudonocardia adelaidensis]|uniref:Uncharacterized protein n=1 Tax=Pseudonocardia adelaidensis TaxID=648754 RepID=A0ABP9NT21_9PSEU
MAGEEQAVPPVPAQHGEPHQWRAREVERGAPVGGHDRLGALRALRVGHPRQIDLRDRRREARGDDGDRAVEPGVGEAQSQRRVLLQQERARLSQRVHVEPGVEVERVLREVHVPLARDPGLEEQALLERRQRPDVGDRAGARRLDRLYVVQGEVDEREVRRRVPAQLGTPRECA